MKSERNSYIAPTAVIYTVAKEDLIRTSPAGVGFAEAGEGDFGDWG